MARRQLETKINIDSPSDDNELTSDSEHDHLLEHHSSSLLNIKLTKTHSSPSTISQSIETNTKNNDHPLYTRSQSRFVIISQSSVETTDDDLDDNYEIMRINSNKKYRSIISNTRQSPNDVRIDLFPNDNQNQNLSNMNTLTSSSIFEDETNHSKISIIDRDLLKPIRKNSLRRILVENRLNRRKNSSISIPRSSNRRYSSINLPHRLHRRY